jgi:hypothetical protein
MLMPPDRLDAMYAAGFCDETLEHAAGTALSAQGRTERLAWAAQHVLGCDDCRRANRLKEIEEKVAKALGRMADFENGKDLQGAPGFTDALNNALRGALASGVLTTTDLAWMARMAKRYGNPWPGREETRP